MNCTRSSGGLHDNLHGFQTYCYRKMSKVFLNIDMHLGGKMAEFSLELTNDYDLVSIARTRMASCLLPKKEVICIILTLYRPHVVFQYAEF
jgi:hypothetical protein